MFTLFVNTTRLSCQDAYYGGGEDLNNGRSRNYTSGEFCITSMLANMGLVRGCILYIEHVVLMHLFQSEKPNRSLLAAT